MIVQGVSAGGQLCFGGTDKESCAVNIETKTVREVLVMQYRPATDAHVRLMMMMMMMIFFTCCFFMSPWTFEAFEAFEALPSSFWPRDGQLAAGFTSVALFVTNAAMTPSTGVGNTWAA